MPLANINISVGTDLLFYHRKKDVRIYIKVMGHIVYVNMLFIQYDSCVITHAKRRNSLKFVVANLSH